MGNLYIDLVRFVDITVFYTHRWSASLRADELCLHCWLDARVP